MALTSYPFEAQATTEVQYGLLFRQFADTGVVGNLDGPGFAVSTDSSGLDLQVAPGFAIIRGHAADNSAITNVVVEAADAANPRIDVVLLRLDPVGNTIALTVKKGTPAAAPVAPGLDQTGTGLYELALAHVEVPAGALNIVPGNITDVRQYSGTQVGVWKTETRPKDAIKSKLGFNVTLNSYEFWNGTKWQPLGDQKKTVRVPHTFMVVGPVMFAQGDDYYIPGFAIPVPFGQTARIVGAHARINSGTNVTYDMTLNGLKLTGSEHVVTTSASDGPLLNKLVTMNNAELSIRITAITGEPKNLRVTVMMEYTV